MAVWALWPGAPQTPASWPLAGGGSGGGSQLLPDPDQGCPDVGGKGGGAAAAGTSAAGGQGAGLQPMGAPPGSQLLGGPGQSSQDPVTPHRTPCHTTHHTSECDDPVVTAHITALSGVSLQLSQHPSTQQQQLPSSCGAEGVRGKEVPAVPGPPLAPSPGALGSTSPASLAAALLPPAPELHSPRYRPGTLATAPQLLSSLMSSPRPQALAAGGGGLASLMPCSPRYVDAPRRNSLPGPSFLSSPRPASPACCCPRYVDAPRRNSLPGPSFLSSPRPASPLSAAGGAPLAGQLSLPSPRSSWTAHAWGSSSRGHLGAHLGGLGSPLLSGGHLSPRPAGMPRLLPPPFPSPSPLGSLAAAAAGGGVGRAADLLTGTTARFQTALAPAGERPGGAGLPAGVAAEVGQAAAAQGGEEKGEAGVSRQGRGPGTPGCSWPTTAAASTRSTQQPATGPSPALGPRTGSHTG
ncbi:hypothetical protein HaLaN_28560, partial [Haematococcus lacustris]